MYTDPSLVALSLTTRLLVGGLVELDNIWPRARSGVGWIGVRMQETISKVLDSMVGEVGIGNIGYRVLIARTEGLILMLDMSIILQCRQAILVARNVA